MPNAKRAAASSDTLVAHANPAAATAQATAPTPNTRRWPNRVIMKPDKGKSYYIAPSKG